MSCVYVVRCNFSRPDLAGRWNEWYSGPKLAEMLSKPYFLSGQRFRAAGMDRSLEYLAVWVLDSPAAFDTPEYRSRWGFFEWTPLICDWSRNLYGGPAGGAPLTERLAVAPDQALYVAALDGAGAADPEPRQAALAAARPDVLWLRAIGLDQSCPLIGLGRLEAGAAGPDPLPPALAEGVRETVYRPISPFTLAGSV